MAPSAIVLAGAGMAGAILGGLPIAAAAAVGAAVWAARVAIGIPRGPKRERVNPNAVQDPWRKMVRDALDAQQKFDTTVGRMRPGPLRERLAGVGDRLADGVQECWRIACQGNDMQLAYWQLDVKSIQMDLAQLQAERKASTGDTDHSASLDRAIASVKAQLVSAERIRSVAEDASDRLRVLDAQLDEAVARAVELSVQADDVGDISPLGNDVDSLVGELESLRQGLEETHGTGGAAAASAS
ncbi:MAG: hypothetical protein JOZ37_19560 [Actinobacteria bacterium]|nr:hypothetical protein [Actinomycetota bacterium]MBV9254276.1 hypothetical protein [Actinomycetota bacterium]MBV9666169.1 hypothetical protein [Actinomycetota bacterium]